MVNRVSDKVQVMGGTAQDGAGGTKSVGVTDGVTQTATDVVTQTAADVVAEYVKMTGAGRARLVPVSYVDELLATLVAGGATVVEPLAGVPVEVCDIKGRAAAGELLVADVRAIGAEFSPACRLGAELAVAEDARVPGYVVVCMRKCCIPWVAEAVEAKACSAEDVTVSATGAEEQASARVSRHAASDAAQVVAAFLACHPRVEAVRWACPRIGAANCVATRSLRTRCLTTSSAWLTSTRSSARKASNSATGFCAPLRRICSEFPTQAQSQPQPPHVLPVLRGHRALPG